MTQFRIGIIGTTGTARKRTIPGLEHSSRCQVVAIQGRNLEKVSALAEENCIPKYYTDARQMLASEELDVVFIGTPPFLHREGIELCLEFSRPIICEKPLAQSYEEAVKIAKSLKARPDIPFMVAHHLRHQQALPDIKTAIENGVIGEILSVQGRWGYYINTDAPSFLWKGDPALGGGGTLEDVGSHMIDFIQAIFGNPEAVSGRSLNLVHPRHSDIFNNEVAFLHYPNMTAVLHSSWLMKHSPNDLIIYGTAGSIYGPGFFGEKQCIELHINRVDGSRVLKYSGDENRILFRNEVENFCDHHLNATESAEKGTTLEEAVMALKIIDLVRRSSVTGQSIRVG